MDNYSRIPTQTAMFRHIYNIIVYFVYRAARLPDGSCLRSVFLDAENSSEFCYRDVFGARRQQKTVRAFVFRGLQPTVGPASPIWVAPPCGGNGSGNYVKMVHDDIIGYGVMQPIAASGVQRDRG